jgi:phospholipase A1
MDAGARLPPRILAGALLFAAACATAQDLATCTAIDDDSARLRCYDSVSGRTQRAPQEAATPEVRYRWEQHLLEDATREPFSLQPYQPTYLLLTQLESFNYAPYRAGDPDDRFSKNEIKLSFSLQTKLADDLVRKNGDLWFAYTQTSYWQLFNIDFSSPFRETNHNPEVRLAFLTNYDLHVMTLRGFNLGLMHDSNGQSGSLSRSWNRAFAEFQLTKGSLIVSIRPWLRVFAIDDNPDIEDYYGHFDVRASWERRNRLLSVTLRNPLDRHYGAQLSWSFPIAGRLRGLVEWYYGYGENLIDYNHRNNRISVGMMVSDWL